MMPQVSVIIPACRAETFIARAVRSVLAQSMQDFEIVIGADDAQDYPAVLAAQGITDPRLRQRHTGGTRTGSARARNCAYADARGRFVAMLDSDDAWLPEHLERMLPLAQRHGAAVTQVRYGEHDGGAALPNRGKPFASGLLALDEILLACIHTYNPIMFDRQKITHGWRERVPLLVDAVFLAECYNTLPAVWYAAEPTYRYFRRDDSVCNAPHAAQRFLEAGRIILSLLDDGGIPATDQVKRVMKAYIARNDQLEIAFEEALKAGEVADYQQFIGRRLDLLHAPLL